MTKIKLRIMKFVRFQEYYMENNKERLNRLKPKSESVFYDSFVALRKIQSHKITTTKLPILVGNLK